MVNHRKLYKQLSIVKKAHKGKEHVLLKSLTGKQARALSDTYKYIRTWLDARNIPYPKEAVIFISKMPELAIVFFNHKTNMKRKKLMSRLDNLISEATSIPKHMFT